MHEVAENFLESSKKTFFCSKKLTFFVTGLMKLTTKDSNPKNCHCPQPRLGSTETDLSNILLYPILLFEDTRTHTRTDLEKMGRKTLHEVVI